MQKTTLRAGRLKAEYSGGFLRYIRLGNTEIVRMIYFALRDVHWETLSLRIVRESILQLENGFQIDLVAESIQDTSAILRWDARIEGKAGEQILFDLTGTYLKDFDRNRAGFCLLHPLRETTGMPFRVSHPDGQVSERIFPVSISPHQPCKDIAGFSWRTSNGVQAEIGYKGEVFEMEDQRNWTDASFKTYCTPLEIPFPVREPAGRQFRQSVALRVSVPDDAGSSIHSVGRSRVEIETKPNQTKPFPRLGSCLPLGFPHFHPEDIPLLTNLHFDSIRVEIQGGKADPYEGLDSILKLSDRLQMPLHLFIHAFPGFHEQSVRDLRDRCPPERLRAITLARTVERVLPALRVHFPGIRIGIGTPYYFTQFNRKPPDTGSADHACFSNNPQVHAFDDASLVETLEGQAATVYSAKKLCPDTEIWVSPVSLRSRFNPDAGREMPPAGVYAHPPDPRIADLFTAGWTIGCLSALANAGADHIDFYELFGPRGLVESSIARPVYLIFRWLLSLSDPQLFYINNPAPLRISTLGIESDVYFYVLLVNHTLQKVPFTLPEKNNWKVAWILDKENLKQQIIAGQLLEVGENTLPDQLPPHTCAAFFRAK